MIPYYIHYFYGFYIKCYYFSSFNNSNFNLFINQLVEVFIINSIKIQ